MSDRDSIAPISPQTLLSTQGSDNPSDSQPLPSDNEQPQGRSDKNKKKKKSAVDTDPLPGLRDFYPEDLRVRNWLFGQWREVARLFSFQEFDAPMLESDALYKRKGGEEITGQMYNFVDKGDRPVALRPEMTPSLVRLVMKQGKKMLFPIRWFSIPQCWRYESTTRGRKREHYQWNMDILGISSITAEAELLAAMVTFFKRVGLTSVDVGIRINSRKLLQSILESLGVAKQFAEVCVIIDKHDKISSAEIETQLVTKVGLDPGSAKKILATLRVRDVVELQQHLGETNEAAQEITALMTYADSYGIREWLQFDASVVRGLTYYTGIVFEAFDRKGELRAIAGGGRYDRLMSTYGAPEDIPAVGFGFGDCVIYELLKERHLLPDARQKTNVVVVPYDEQLRAAAIGVAARIREAGFQVDLQLELNKKLGWCFSYADRVGAVRIVLIGPEEWCQGEVRVKELKPRQDKSVEQSRGHNTTMEKDKGHRVKLEDLLAELKRE